MRILFHHRIASRDNQSVQLEELMAALTAEGYDILLVGPKLFASAGFDSSNAPVDTIKRLIPGLTPYSSPLKLFEYLQLGCAIVAPDMENIREVLTDGQDALLFSPDQPGAMEAAILKPCASAELRQRLGRAGQDIIMRKSLTWAQHTERVAAVAAALLDRSHAKHKAAENGDPCAD
jgi:glycosyltransferase involved in cell wall biosynthesis